MQTTFTKLKKRKVILQTPTKEITNLKIWKKIPIKREKEELLKTKQLKSKELKKSRAYHHQRDNNGRPLQLEKKVGFSGYF